MRAADRARVRPLLVLLHGLGETADERLGARAWIDRYGLVEAVARLRHPPVTRVSSTPPIRRGARDDWTDAQLAAVNADVAAMPYRGLVVACPAMPNVSHAGLDAYARWLCDEAIPFARREAGDRVSDVTLLGGCSLGGWASLEIFLRRPELFAAWGGVQSALSMPTAMAFANRLARVVDGGDRTGGTGRQSLLVESSTEDPFLVANEALAAALVSRGVWCDRRVLPGPHDQAWLRESGTLEALLWFDRRG